MEAANKAVDAARSGAAHRIPVHQFGADVEAALDEIEELSWQA